MKRWLVILGAGAAGALVAIGLSFAAFALAGKDIGEPANAFQVGPASPTPGPAASESPTPERSEKPGKGDDQTGSTVQPTSTVENYGGTSASPASGSGSSSGGSEGDGSSHEGPGSSPHSSPAPGGGDDDHGGGDD